MMEQTHPYLNFPKYHQAKNLPSPPWVYLRLFGPDYYYVFCRHCHGPIVSHDPEFIQKINEHDKCRDGEADGYIWLGYLHKHNNYRELQYYNIYENPLFFHLQALL